MPIYRITSPDGIEYSVEAPEGASKSELVQRVLAGEGKTEEDLALDRKISELESSLAEARKPKPTLGGYVKEAFKGIPAGAVNLLESAGTGISALLPENAEKATRGFISRAAESARAPFEAAPGYEESVVRKLSEGLGSTAPFFALGPLGIAGRLGAAGLGTSAGAGEARTRAEAAGATEEERAKATALGVPIGLMEILAPFGADKVIGRVKRALAAGGIEGAQEAAAEMAQNAVAQGVYNPNQEILAGTGEAGAYGAGVGALAQALLDAALPGRMRAAAKARAERDFVGPPLPGPEDAGPLLPKPEDAGPPLPGPEEAGPLLPGPEDAGPPLPGPEDAGPPLPGPEEAGPPTEVFEEQFYKQVELEEKIGKQNEAEVERVKKLREERTEEERQREAAQAALDRMKRQTATETTDLRVEEGRKRESEASRRAILDPILESPMVPSMYEETFARQLKEAGFRDTTITPQEKARIARATELRALEDQRTPAEDQTGEMEQFIREKGAPRGKTVQPPKTLAAPELQLPQIPEIPKLEPSIPTTNIAPPAAPKAPLMEEGQAAPTTPTTVTPAAPVIKPKVEAPKVEAPKVEAPKVEAPKVEAPKVEAPKVEAPKVEAPKVEAPKVEAPKVEAPKVEATEEVTEDEDAGNAEWQALASEPVKSFYSTISTQFKGLPGGKSEVGDEQDKPKVKSLRQSNERTLKKEEKAARNYFLKVPRTVDALRLIAFDEVYKTPRFRKEGETSQEAEFFKGLNGEQAKLAREWVNKNLSKKVVNKLDRFITGYEIEKILDEETLIDRLRSWANKPTELDETIASYLDQNKIDAITDLRETFNKKLELGVDAAIVANPLHPVVAAKLETGDLVGTLRLLAASQGGNIGKLATKLADKLGDTKVKITKNLKNEEGQPVAGLYDPKTNTIELDAEMGMNAHTLLHETTHALTSATLENKSHPVTKQLETLYNDIKESLDTFYGSQSLDEFVAEAFSNPEFQAKLQAINPKGEPITAWQRFTHAIKNMLRRLIGLDSKPLESAADRADTLIEAILFPSPETRNAGALYQVALKKDGDKVLDRLGKMAEKLPLLNQKRVDKIHEVFSTLTPDALRNGLLKVLPLHAFVEVAEKYVPGVTKFKKLLDEKKGAEQRRYEGVEATVKYVSDWAGKNPSLVDPLNNVIYTSTTEQVDPSKPASEYKDEKLKAYNALQSDWNKLGKDGQTVYNTMRDTYKKMYEDTRKVIEGRIDAMGLDQASSAKVKKDIYQKLLTSGTIEPYFPLTRTGEYRLVYHAFSPRSNTTELFVEHFETPRARDRAIEELKQDKDVKADTIQKFTSLEKFDYKSAPPSSFVSSMLKSLEAAKIKATPQQKKQIDESIESTMRMFLDLLPETSFAQSFRRRKNKGRGVLGFEHDAIGALKTKGFSLARQLSNIEYGAKFDAFMNKVREDFKVKGNPEDAKPYIEELDTRVRFARSPNVPQWAKVATSFGFNMTLGFNVSSAIVNLSQIPLVVVPYLASRHGLVDTMAAVGRASRIFMTSGTTREIETLVGGKKVKVRSMPSLDNIDFSKNPKLKHLETLVTEAERTGKLNRSMTQDILEFDEKDTLMNKVNAASGWVFHQGERMNRQVSLVAAYELNLKKLKKEGKTGKTAELEAAQKALYDVELTNGGTFAEAAPSIAQNPIGKIIFMYKNYGVSMYYMLFKGTRDALSAQDPEVRKAAKKQIAGIYASAALMAGARGLPMFGVAAMIYNLFSDDDEDDFDTAARKWMGETLYGGLLNELTGLEIGGRIGLSDLLFRDTTVKDQESALLSLMETMGGPVLGVASRMERGLSLVADGYVARGIEQMLPSAMGNALKSIRYGTEGTQTLRGDPITGEVGPWNTAAQAFGFAPADYIRQMEENSAVKKLDKAISTEKTKLLRRYYMALRQGDGDEMSDVAEAMQDYNGRHPGNAITGETIKKSMAQHMRTSATMYHGITIGKKNWNEVMQSLAEYDRDIDED